ncbi:hypothetical protein XENTR_v10019836 [Xenopus tropicalis]|nr:hypothetical protein XENTR_v10019836 [Xenopus tropicalis]
MAINSKTQTAPPVKNVIAGGIGGMCLILAGQPLDTIKVNLQTQPSPALGQQPLYNSTLHCFSKIIAREGIRGLYRGMGAPLAVVTPIMSITFVGFGLGKSLQQTSPDSILRSWQVFVAGMLAGLSSTVLMAPGERIKCLLQVQSVTLKKTFQGPLDCAQTLYRELGIRGLYRGTLLTLIRDVPSTGVYFMSYEWMKEKMRGERSSARELRATEILLAGGVAGMCNWLVAIPADVLKSRFQTAPENHYKNILEVLREVLHSEGPCGLYRGFTAAMLRAFPANAVRAVGPESVQ